MMNVPELLTGPWYIYVEIRITLHTDASLGILLLWNHKDIHPSRKIF